MPTLLALFFPPHYPLSPGRKPLSLLATLSSSAPYSGQSLGAAFLIRSWTYACVWQSEQYFQRQEHKEWCLAPAFMQMRHAPPRRVERVPYFTMK